ncbi:MAG: glycine--tRNA ligase [Limisphaerales bacterium]|jgi:glycyl-tRNA synthetase|nr:glycine--tRNA ligase [Verrucomicrobiota bacterium]
MADTKEKKQSETMEKIVSLCKRRGFIFQSSEIYGGINGFWDYGPLGAELKRNLKDIWWRSMTQEREDMAGIDATIIMHPKIWDASGHTTTFADPMVDCLLSKKRFRADQVTPLTGTAWFWTGAVDKESGKACNDPFSMFQLPGKDANAVRKGALLFYKERGLEEPELQGETTKEVTESTQYNEENGSLLTEPRAFNLMLKTHVGPVESADNVAYLRPETAQAIFAQFKIVHEVSRKSVPFGICQIGKAFRNEINPRNFTFRSREFEQMEIEYFIRPDEVAATFGPLPEEDPGGEPQPNWGWKAWHAYWLRKRLEWYETIGLERDSLELYWQTPEELAHYAKATVDILYKFPFGTQELEGIAARGNFDLSQHQKFSGKSMEYYDEAAKTKYIPHVVEPSAGVDRMVLAVICHAYHEEIVTDEKGKSETRIVMKFHPRVAPIKVGIFPLLKNKPELVAKAREVQALLRPHMNVFYDDAGAIGRRYRRQDEAGTPFGVTIDFDTLGEDPILKDTVTLRDRDTMKQSRVHINDLLPTLLSKLQGPK